MKFELKHLETDQNGFEMRLKYLIIEETEIVFYSVLLFNKNSFFVSLGKRYSGSG